MGAAQRANAQEEQWAHEIRHPQTEHQAQLAARASVKRMVRNSLGLKAPRGMGWITDPKRAAYNRVYDRTTVSFWGLLRKIFGG